MRRSLAGVYERRVPQEYEQLAGSSVTWDRKSPSDPINFLEAWRDQGAGPVYYKHGSYASPQMASFTESIKGLEYSLRTLFLGTSYNTTFRFDAAVRSVRTT